MFIISNSSINNNLPPKKKYENKNNFNWMSSILCLYKGGWTALYWAAFNGHLEVATLLVDAGASIDIPDDVSTLIRLYMHTNLA